jgi:uncharacterized protein YndB with AHSA1/START domain
LADYRFVTVWRLRAPIGAVWQAIVESENWPRWWQGVQRVSLLRDGDAQGLGEIRRYVWRSKLPYTLAFDMEATRSEAPRLLEGRASGELEGTGLWELSEEDGLTTVRYTWSVRTTRRWMNLLAPLGRRAFAWNHDYVMANGARGLSRLLGAELVAVEGSG